MQKEALSFHSRSQNVKMLGRVLAGKVKRAEGKDGRGKSEGQEPRGFHADRLARTKRLQTSSR